ncbi:hypothetical protein CH63R_00051 [Colletotrichum higginsianum IMI 349063]|uniref:Uncharacterized protein n=1 Tax=Colletotrichum higginsianum (strain IMI 349063) TaxID=759273 RepID=A0A1B7YS69_COLHI|nr:hypothetical protein CH63R_00051 [Colletotrichum higginsianum IMI 349063]OBR14871.1 hypothetical protein CH63R_00051 [Colletotrichum higginsianum IMI 349063]
MGRLRTDTLRLHPGPSALRAPLRRELQHTPVAKIVQTLDSTLPLRRTPFLSANPVILGRHTTSPPDDLCPSTHPSAVRARARARERYIEGSSYGTRSTTHNRFLPPFSRRGETSFRAQLLLLDDTGPKKRSLPSPGLPQVLPSPTPTGPPTRTLPPPPPPAAAPPHPSPAPTKD